MYVDCFVSSLYFNTFTCVIIGSVYCDGELWKSGMIGEGIKGSSVLVVKSHTLKVSVTTY